MEGTSNRGRQVGGTSLRQCRQVDGTSNRGRQVEGTSNRVDRWGGL